MTIVIRLAEVAEKAISVRLDAEALRALERLTGSGVSQSQAIRAALIDAARAAIREHVRLDAERIAGDADDRAVMAEIREYMDDLAPPG